MSDSLQSGDDQLQKDLFLAWAYALNADLGPDPQTVDDPDHRQEVLQKRHDRYTGYARDLLHDLGVDPDRLAAVAAACRAEHDRHLANGYAAAGDYAIAAHLAELALAAIRRAEVEAGPAGRQRLVTEFDQERRWSPRPYKQGL
jgi:hypothetical protein